MTEKSIKREITQQLSEKFDTSVEIISEKILGGGCINNASKIITNVGNFFLKWNNNLPTDIFVREAESLRALKKAARNSIAIPKVITAKAIDNTSGYLLLEFLPSGANPINQKKLGIGLAIIHQYQNDKFGFYNDNYCGATRQDNRWNKDWAEFFGQQRLWYLVKKLEKQNKLSASQIKVYKQLINRLHRLLPNNSPASLIHGDLWSGNYMHISSGFALIDPAAYYANREMELGILTMFGGFSESFWQGYNETYPLPAGWKERNQLYQLYHVLNHYYLFGGRYGMQAINIAKSYL